MVSFFILIARKLRRFGPSVSFFSLRSWDPILTNLRIYLYELARCFFSTPSILSHKLWSDDSRELLARSTLSTHHCHRPNLYWNVGELNIWDTLLTTGKSQTQAVATFPITDTPIINKGYYHFLSTYTTIYYASCQQLLCFSNSNKTFKISTPYFWSKKLNFGNAK